LSEESEKKSFGWEEFCEYAEQQGISLANHEDYAPWWDCWRAGIRNFIKAVRHYAEEGKKYDNTNVQ